MLHVHDLYNNNNKLSMTAPEEPKAEAKEEEAKAQPNEETKHDDDDANKEEQPKKEADPAVVEAVAERLRFFLSDANLRQDTFLRKLMLSTHGEYPHHVTPDILLRFNTIKQHTTDPEVVLAAAKSLDSFLVLSEDGKAIGLKEKFSMDKMDDNLPKSFFLENVPHDEIRYKVGPEEIRKLFEAYGKVALVKLRFHLPSKRMEERPKRVPAGSALVEFEAVEAFEKAAEEVLTTVGGETVEPKRKLELEGSTLKVLRLKEYVENRKSRKKDKREKGGDESRGDKRDRPEDTPDSPSKTFSIDWKPGCVIRLEGLSATECDREALLDTLASGLGITTTEVKERKIYVDYSRGQEIGALRFPEPSDEIKALCEKLNAGDVKVKEDKVSKARILDGEEESKYWTDFVDFKTKQMQQRGGDRHHGRNKRSRHRH